MNCYSRFLAAVVLVFGCVALIGCKSGPKYDSDPFSSNGGSTAGTSQNFGDPASPMNPPPTTPTSATNPTQQQNLPIDYGNVLHVGESLVFNFSDTPTPVAPMEVLIKDDGTVTLIYNQKFVAAGKTVGLLQNEIRDRYVPQYYKFLTVSIKTEERFFSVGGQVRAPNRVQYSTKMTVLQAINTAGGFTDFASKKRVQIIRADHKKLTVNCVKALEDPSLDVEIFPGDQIYVPKRVW